MKLRSSYYLEFAMFMIQVCGSFSNWASYHQVLECNHKQWQWPVKFGGLWDLSGQQLQKVIFFLSLGLSVASRRGTIVLIQGKFILVHFHICTLYMCTYIICRNMYLGSFYSCRFSIAFLKKRSLVLSLPTFHSLPHPPVPRPNLTLLAPFFPFRSFVHFKLIFVQGKISESNFILLQGPIGLPVPCWIGYHVSLNAFASFFQKVIGLSAYFCILWLLYLSTYQFLCQYQVIFIAIVLWYHFRYCDTNSCVFPLEDRFHFFEISYDFLDCFF